jgi:hypothetical protein
MNISHCSTFSTFKERSNQYHIFHFKTCWPRRGAFSCLDWPSGCDWPGFFPRWPLRRSYESQLTYRWCFNCYGPGFFHRWPLRRSYGLNWPTASAHLCGTGAGIFPRWPLRRSYESQPTYRWCFNCYGPGTFPRWTRVLWPERLR